MTLLDRLTQIFREVFDDDEIALAPETTADDIDAWDSLSHANLVVTIEERLGVRFAMKELLAFRNVGDMIRCIEAKLSPKKGSERL